MQYSSAAAYKPSPSATELNGSSRRKTGCTCKYCLKFIAFAEDPTVKSMHFDFGTESRFAHYKTYQLAQITTGGFQHTCTITPTENGGVDSYSITVRRTKAQFAMGTERSSALKTRQKSLGLQHQMARQQLPSSSLSTPQKSKERTNSGISIVYLFSAENHPSIMSLFQNQVTTRNVRMILQQLIPCFNTVQWRSRQSLLLFATLQFNVRGL